MKILLKNQILLAAVTAAPCYADLAIDFREGRVNTVPDSSLASDTASVLAAFQGADPLLESTATLVINMGDTPINNGESANAGSSWNDLGAPGQIFGNYTVATSGGVSGYRAGSGSWNDLAVISESYAFNKVAGQQQIATITADTGFPAAIGDVITLTCWGVGDNVNQDALFSATYSGSSPQTAETRYNDAANEPRDSSVGSIPWVQFQFLYDGTDSISFSWERNSTGDTAAFNGFSLSFSEPSFGEVTSATLTGPEATTVLVGSPDAQLSASAEFAAAGAVNVTGLGSSVISFTSDNPSVATVNGSGLVTFGAPGVANISATVSGDAGSEVTSNTATFTVEAPTSFTFNLPDPYYMLSYGFTEGLDVTADSASLTGVAVEGFTGFSYDTSNFGVVDVDTETGLLTPYVPGTVSIEAELLIPGQTAFTASTTVVSEEALTISATATTDTLYIGGAGTTITSVVTTANGAAPWVINSVPGADFMSDQVSDIFVDLDGVVTTGIDENFLGESVITASWLLSDGANTITDTVNLTLSAIPAKPTTLLHWYDFDNSAGSAPNGTIIVDSVGGADGVVVDDDAVFTGEGLTLPGGAQNPEEGETAGAYVDLPNGMISALPAATTFEAWVTVDSTGNWLRLFDFGNSEGGEDSPGYQTNHFMLTPRRSGGAVASESSLARRSNGSATTFTSGTITSGVKHYYVVTYDSEVGVRNIYLDGQLVGSGELPFGNSALADFVDGEGAPNDLNNWLGRSNAGDARLAGTYDDFRIYSGTMTAAEVAANFTAATGGGGLDLSVAGFSANTLNVDVTGLGVGTTYHFQRLNTGTEEFEAIPGSQFDAAAAAESKAIDVSGLSSTELVRVIEGVIP